MTKKYLTILFALTFFVSAFVLLADVPTAQASGNQWNIDIVVCHNGNEVCYNLANNVADATTTQANNSCYFCGSKSKLQLYRQLKQMQLPMQAVCNYLLPNFYQTMQSFNYVNATKVDSTVSLTNGKFSYVSGNDGVAIDWDKLITTALSCCGKTNYHVSLPLIIDKAVTVSQLKSNTVLKGTFTTSFVSSNASRSHNIALATATVNGTVVQPNQTFSFNKVVGPRTEQNGYLTSKVILDGNYTDGVGGGVCQVSTTLYNALLLSEFIPRAVQHSLVSSYVLPGFDAMVSYGSADMTFTNNTSSNVYIVGKTNNKQITFSIYGVPNNYRVERISENTRTPYQTKYVTNSKLYPQLLYTDQTFVVTHGSDGVVSKSYLCYYKGDKLVEKKLIRSNKYKQVDKIVARGSIEREQNQ